MGQGRGNGGLIRQALVQILVADTVRPSRQIVSDLFFNLKTITMAINWGAVKKMTLAQLLEYPEFKQQFIHMYDCHKGQDYYIGGEAFYEQEISFMLTLFRDNPKLAASTTVSIASAMVSGVAYHGLSIEPVSKGFAYLIPTPFNSAAKNQPPNWIETVKYRISAYGELELRRRNGVIVSVKNPVMVYEGDLFEPTYKTIGGKTKIEISHIPRRKSQKITDAYIILALPNGEEDVKIFSIEEIQGFRKMNKNEAMRNSPMWTGGFEGQPLRGTIEAKVIKHAFSTYPRLNLGISGAQLETDVIDKGEAAVERQFDRDATLADVMGGNGQEEYDHPDNQNYEEPEEDLGPFTPPTQPVKEKAATHTPPQPDPPIKAKADRKFEF